MDRTLVLDLGYQPHRIVSWQRAITMLFQGKVEVVEEYDEIVYSGRTLVLRMPAVVRLLQRVARRKAVRFSRMNVLARDNWTCQYCGRRFPTRELNYDHVIPRSQGGKTGWENIVSACYGCNDRKANRTPRQAGMRLIKQPVKPASLPVIALHFDPAGSIPEAWANWVYWHGELEQG
jgi:5-methylcytosine-specific restriction endonuclease McrA